MLSWTFKQFEEVITKVKPIKLQASIKGSHIRLTTSTFSTEVVLFATGENRGLCMICVMEDHIRAVSNRQIYTPWPIIKSLRSKSGRFPLQVFIYGNTIQIQH